jgi:hypothetical protein
MRSRACDEKSRFTNEFSIFVKKCLMCDVKNAANWANYAILWIIVLSTSLSQFIANRFFLLCMIFWMHYCCSDEQYMLSSRRWTQRRLMLNLRRSRSRHKFESKSSKLTFEKIEKWSFIINRSSQNLRCVNFRRFKHISWRFTLLLTFLQIISLCQRCLCFRVRRSIRVRRVEYILTRIKKMIWTTTTMMKKAARMKIMKMMSKTTTKIRMRVKKTSTQISKTIKMISTSNHLKNLLKRKLSRRMIKKMTSSSRERMKETMKWNRRKTTSTRIAHQVAISRATSLTSKRKSLLCLLLLSVASYQSRRLIQSLRLIFDEVRDVCRKHRSKKKNDRLSTKMKTSSRCSNVVVAQNFDRFLFFCMIK